MRKRDFNQNSHHAKRDRNDDLVLAHNHVHANTPASDKASASSYAMEGEGLTGVNRKCREVRCSRASA